jgi:acetyl-CoA acetyltransferase
MNQSFDASSNNYHLPRIAQNDSAYLRTTNKQSADMRRSASYSQAAKNPKANLTRKLVVMEDIKNAEEYENMNEKELLREH